MRDDFRAIIEGNAESVRRGTEQVQKVMHDTLLVTAVVFGSMIGLLCLFALVFGMAAAFSQ